MAIDLGECSLGVLTGLPWIVGRLDKASIALDMLRLRWSLDEPGSELGSFLVAVAPGITDAIGSMSSRSGLGMPRGAKSASRNLVAIRTVAAARV